MEIYLMWAAAGFLLIIAEIMTGTFYLLVLGIAALVGALTAYMGGTIWPQVIAVGAVALLGFYLVHRWRQSQPKTKEGESNNLDMGQQVKLERWLDEARGQARVHYRGSQWDATVEGSAVVGDTLTITGREQGVLLVGK